MAKRRKVRTYSTGSRMRPGIEGSSRVRVYERVDRPVGQFFMTRAWVIAGSGRPQEVALAPGTTWEAAKVLADLTASNRRKLLLAGRTELGERKRITLLELLRRYHESDAASRWSAKHAIDKRVARDFWLGALGETYQWDALTPAEVLRLAHAEKKRRGASVRTERKRIEYLRAVARWAYEKARLTPENPLRGIELPEYSPDTSRQVYTLAEAQKLKTPHEDVDWRVTLACGIASATGRRLTAIRHLNVFGNVFLRSKREASDVELRLTERREEVEGFGQRIRRELESEDGRERGRVWVFFAAEYDKKRQAAKIPLPTYIGLLIADALQRTEVAEHGWLFPGGWLDRTGDSSVPISNSALLKQLHRAEAVLGIPTVRGRGFHGIKRRHVTVSFEKAPGDVSLVGDVTGNRSPELLRNVYRQLSEERMEAHIDAIWEEFEG